MRACDIRLTVKFANMQKDRFQSAAKIAFDDIKAIQNTIMLLELEEENLEDLSQSGIRGSFYQELRNNRSTPVEQKPREWTSPDGDMQSSIFRDSLQSSSNLEKSLKYPKKSIGRNIRRDEQIQRINDTFRNDEHNDDINSVFLNTTKSLNSIPADVPKDAVHLQQSGLDFNIESKVPELTPQNKSYRIKPQLCEEHNHAVYEREEEESDHNDDFPFEDEDGSHTQSIDEYELALAKTREEYLSSYKLMLEAKSKVALNDYEQELEATRKKKSPMELCEMVSMEFLKSASELFGDGDNEKYDKIVESDTIFSVPNLDEEGMMYYMYW